MTRLVKITGILLSPHFSGLSPPDHILMLSPLKTIYDCDDWNVLNKSVIAAALLSVSWANRMWNGSLGDETPDGELWGWGIWSGWTGGSTGEAGARYWAFEIPSTGKCGRFRDDKRSTLQMSLLISSSVLLFVEAISKTWLMWYI